MRRIRKNQLKGMQDDKVINKACVKVKFVRISRDTS